MVDSTGFGAAMAKGTDWRACVGAVIAELGNTSNATLGIAYWTDVLAADADGILQSLRERTGIEQWVGTVALGVSGADGVAFDQPALSVMVGGWPEETFRILPALAGTANEFDPADAEWLQAHSPHVALVHADQGTPALEDAMTSLASAMGGGFLIGGIGSSRAECPQFANGVVQGGLSGVAFAGETGLLTRLSQGCTPIGRRHTVTAGEGNVILTLDGRPALDVFKEDIGEVLARDLRRVAGYIFAGFAVPHSDTGEYLVRNLVGLDPDAGALAVGEYVSEGDVVMFCRRDPQSAVDDMERMARELVTVLDGRTPKGGVYVSCLARGPNQFEPDDLELQVIREHLGEFPLTGFFANGEISNDRLYGYTGVLTLFI